MGRWQNTGISQYRSYDKTDRAWLKAGWRKGNCCRRGEEVDNCLNCRPPTLSGQNLSVQHSPLADCHKQVWRSMDLGNNDVQEVKGVPQSDALFVTISKGKLSPFWKIVKHWEVINAITLGQRPKENAWKIWTLAVQGGMGVKAFIAFAGVFPPFFGCISIYT